MLGFVFAFITAFLQSTKDVLGKKFLKKIDLYVLAIGQRIFALPILAIAVFAYSGVPEIKAGYWLALLVSASLNALASVLYLKSIKSSDLSQSVPLLAFSPLLLLATSPIILGEYPTFIGILGVVLIVLGSYLLNIKTRKTGFLSPFKALLKEKGARYMLLVVFVWSISANFDKIGIQNSSAFFWSLSLNAGIALFLLPITIYKVPRLFSQIGRHHKTLAALGSIFSFASLAQMTAVGLTLVPYVISIKRTSTVMSTIAGYIFFKEKNIKERLAGVIIMVIGVILITLFK